jgi:hypothetical protein
MYLGDSMIVARGTRTGLTYLFGAHGEELSVDERDADALIATGSFSRVSP